MPELPEVQTIVTTLRPRLLNRRILGVLLRRADILTPAHLNLPDLLVGRSIAAIDRRGKRIVFMLDNAHRFYIHLGMTGRLTTMPASAPAATHTHLEMDFGEFRLHFRDPRRFGGIFWLGADASPDADMGPEPQSLRPAQLARCLAQTRRAIKSALLDQRLIAGLGNIYVDESLFRAGIHPQTPANQLSPLQIAQLNRAIKTVLRRALRHRGSTLRDYRDGNGVAGAFQRLHRVYDRAGQPCATCKTPIERITLGGRSTHFCPRCQRS